MKATQLYRKHNGENMGLEDLKDRVCTCWASLDQQLINKAIAQGRRRLKTVVDGGHIEQLFT